MHIKNFLSKNLKWVAIICFVLFCFKSIQGCARKSALRKCKEQHIVETDSLKTIIIQKDSLIRELNFDIKTFKTAAQAAEDKAKSVQSAVEKLKTNTTIKIETNKEEKKDK